MRCNARPFNPRRWCIRCERFDSLLLPSPFDRPNTSLFELSSSHYRVSSKRETSLPPMRIKPPRKRPFPTWKEDQDANDIATTVRGNRRGCGLGGIGISSICAAESLPDNPVHAYSAGA